MLPESITKTWADRPDHIIATNTLISTRIDNRWTASLCQKKSKCLEMITAQSQQSNSNEYIFEVAALTLSFPDTSLSKEVVWC